MIPIEKVKEIINKHQDLEKELASGSIDKKKFAQMSKEYSELNDIIQNAKDYLNFDENKKDLEKIINDKKNDTDIVELANLELLEMLEKKEKNEKKLKFFYFPKMKLTQKMLL